MKTRNVRHYTVAEVRHEARVILEWCILTQKERASYESVLSAPRAIPSYQKIPAGVPQEAGLF